MTATTSAAAIRPGSSLCRGLGTAGLLVRAAVMHASPMRTAHQARPVTHTAWIPDASENGRGALDVHVRPAGVCRCAPPAIMNAQPQARARAAGEPACRPGSVHQPKLADGHPSRAAVADSLVRSTHEHRAGRPQTLAQALRPKPHGPSDLAPGGVYLAARITPGAGGLLHHRFTLTLGPARRPGPRAVCFLWHCPAGHPGSALPTTLPCGARTFLTGVSPRRGRPAGSPAAASSIGANQPFLAGKDAPCRSWCALSPVPRHTSRSHTGRRRPAACAAAPPAGRAARAEAGSSSA